jgi:hypothetical protein
MLQTLRNLKTSEIELRQQLPVLECEWPVGRLLAKQGVTDAKGEATAAGCSSNTTPICTAARSSVRLQHRSVGAVISPGEG